MYLVAQGTPSVPRSKPSVAPGFLPPSRKALLPRVVGSCWDFNRLARIVNTPPASSWEAPCLLAPREQMACPVNLSRWRKSAYLIGATRVLGWKLSTPREQPARCPRDIPTWRNQAYAFHPPFFMDASRTKHTHLFSIFHQRSFPRLSHRWFVPEAPGRFATFVRRLSRLFKARRHTGNCE